MNIPKNQCYSASYSKTKTTQTTIESEKL